MQQILPLPHRQTLQQGIHGVKLAERQPAVQIFTVTLQPLVSHQRRPLRRERIGLHRGGQHPAEPYEKYQLHDVPVLVTSRLTYY